VSDTDFERISPEPAAQKPAASIPVFDSEKVLQQLPPGPERQAILGEVEPGENLTLEEAARQLRNRRGEQPASGVDFKVDGRTTTRPQSDREAARDVTFSRRVEHTGRIMQALPGVDVDTAAATAVTAEKGGHVQQYALPDSERADPLSHGDNPQQAQQRLSAMREERAAALHALAEQLSEPLDQQQPAEATQLEQQQPPPSQPEQPAQPDPVEQLRAQAEAEKNAYAQMRQATQVEWQLAQTAQELNTRVTNKYLGQIQQAGGLTPEGLANFAKQNPAGLQELVEAQNLYNTCTANIEHCRQVTQLNQQRMTELQQARARNEHAAWAKQQDDLVTKHVPELADPAQAAPLQRATIAMLTDIGLSEPELRALWNGEAKLDLRDARAQRVLADAAKYREGQAKARVAQKAPLPPVLRPGNGTTKAEANAVDQSAQLARLSGMSPTDAAKAGAKLLAARRSATRHAR
jgi:hypothetical protein